MKQPQLEPNCPCFNHIHYVGRAHWRCAGCKRDMSLEIALMDEDIYNRIKKNITYVKSN